MNQNINKKCINLTMDNLIVSTGWGAVEKKGDIYYRWLNLDDEPTIYLSLSRDVELRLNMVIHDYTCEEALKRLQIKANGLTLQSIIGQSSQPAHLTAIIPKDNCLSCDKPTILSLNLLKTDIPKESLLPSNYTSKHGLAVQSLHIFPLRRPLFIAEKYKDPFLFDGIDYLQNNSEVTDAIVHGIYKSAYDYYKQKGSDNYSLRLHSNFDECPGDLFDILYLITNEQLEDTENSVNEGLKAIRSIVFRQLG